MFNRRTHEIKPLMKNLDKTSEEYKDLDTEQAAIKLSLNGGIFGKLGSVYSWQYDPLQKYRITINCQLKLLELTESLYINGAIIHSANTDGVVIEYSPDIKDKIDKVHKDWEDKYNYILEDTNYNRIFFSTVNDYLAEIINNKGEIIKYKYKGDFEIDKDWHKNHSNRIVSIAIARKCLFDISPEETIRNHMYVTEYEDIGVKAYGIYDFCASVRARGDAKYQTRQWSKGEYIINALPKTNRYFISNTGVELLKVLPPNMNAKDNIAEHRKKYPNQLDLFMFDDDVIVHEDRISQVEAGQKVTMFNRYYEDDYNLNIRYYINECNKILNEKVK